MKAESKRVIVQMVSPVRWRERVRDRMKCQRNILEQKYEEDEKYSRAKMGNILEQKDEKE